MLLSKPNKSGWTSASRQQRAFTLVEILIVVIILGILAAIVIPQFSNASSDARRSNLTSQLQTLRSQIELYKLQHGDQLPNIVGSAPGNWDALMVVVPYQGRNFGPYLQSVPKNPLNNLSSVVNGTGASSTACGFVYDYGTSGDGSGRIWGTDMDGKTLVSE